MCWALLAWAVFLAVFLLDASSEGATTHACSEFCCVQVRLNVLRSLPSLAGVITLEQISEALLPTIDELASDNTWRVRYQLVSLTPQLAKHFGMGFFQQQMVQRALSWLVDRTSVIRTAAAGIICEVAKEFGPEWTKGHLVDEVPLSPFLPCL